MIEVDAALSLPDLRHNCVTSSLRHVTKDSCRASMGQHATTKRNSKGSSTLALEAAGSSLLEDIK